jgi:hypothetical protein
MERLSSSLQLQISSRPLDTILRHEREDLNQKFKYITISSSRKIHIPDYFDGRIAWEGMLTPPMDQGKCGSCWSFASTGMLADRFNIQSLGMMHVQLSATKLILCDWQGQRQRMVKIPDHPEDDMLQISKINRLSFSKSACYGNSLVDSCRYLYEIGTPTEECVPYTKKLGVHSDFQDIGSFDRPSQLPLCSTVSGPLFDMCSDFYIDNKIGIEGGTPERFYKALHYYSIAGDEKDGGNEYNIRDNIYKWGPIATGIKVYPDFYSFNTKNIYEWDGKGQQVGGHAVVIVGWGNEGGKDFWIIRNSWGQDWGDKGYFRMSRGVNMCEIESNCVGVVPDFFYPINYIFPNHELLRETKQMSMERKRIAMSLNSPAGGIDPTTGYTRRVMIQMPWLNLSPPVELKNLPKWEYFIAAEHANVSKYQNLVQPKKNIKNGNPLIIIIVCCVITIVSCLLIYFLIRKNMK